MPLTPDSFSDLASRPSGPRLGSIPTRPPERIGRYSIVRVIGAGGMGTVFEAQQDQPRRTVALKLMRSGIVTRDALRRFEYEAELLARLKHPGIAQVYEAGVHEAHDGVVPYFAMEYVEGALALNDYVSKHRLSTLQRLELFEQVCDAVHHGHAKGVVHRDLKPGNILVDGSGKPKVIDFGVARSTQTDVAFATLQTTVGQLVGTLEYMSPEQASGNVGDIDTRSDVYTLGIVLHQLLCGGLPYEISRADLTSALRSIVETSPKRLGSINTTLAGDIETIVLKALEKDRERRYQTALELGQDLRRFLDKQPITARPPSPLYQLRLFARRNRAAVIAVAGVFVALVLGVVGTTAGFLRAREAQQVAESQRARAESALAEARRESEHTAAVNRFMRDLITQAGPAKAQGRTVTVQEAVELESREIATRYGGTPTVEAAIESTVGALHSMLGQYAKADAHVRRGLELRQTHLGQTHPDTILSKMDLAALLVDRALFDESEALLREVIAILEAQGEQSGTAYARANSSLGWVLYHLGKNDEAEQVYRKGVALSDVTSGPDDPLTIRARAALGMVLIEQNKLDEAEPFVVRGVADARRVMGPRHPFTMYARNVESWMRSIQGKHEESIALQRALLDDASAVYKPGHMHLIYWKQALGWRLASAGQGADAERVFRESLAEHSESLGPDHANTLEVRSGLARALFAQRKFEAALEEAMACREACLTRFGPGSPTAVGVTLLAAEALEALSRMDEAEALRASVAAQSVPASAR